MYEAGEPLWLSPEAEKEAVIKQKEHTERDDREGLIEQYLETPITEDWDSMEITDRRIYLEDELATKGTIRREYVCAAEVWCECLGKERKELTKYNSRDITAILQSIEGWEKGPKVRRFKHYGPQIYYQRVDNGE
jgi:hypothetical protein